MKPAKDLISSVSLALSNKVKGNVSESLHPLTFLYKIITIKIIMRKVFKKNRNQRFLKNNKYFNSKYTKPLQSNVYKIQNW
mgnify:CR=1 FL=1